MSYRRRYKTKKTSWERTRDHIKRFKTIFLFFGIAFAVWLVKEWTYISSWLRALFN